MKKFLILIIILILATVFAYFYFAKDNSKQAAPVIVKTETTNLNSDVKLETNIKIGEFNKIDALHYATGTVEVVRTGDNYKIKFKDNFASAKGPDLYVYLSKSQDFKNRAIGGIDTAQTLNLGVLKSQSGAQEYIISKSDFEKYNAAIVIWCKQFGVQFSRADLK